MDEKLQAFNDRVRGLRAFDAFPKLAPSNTVRSTRGGYSTIFLMVGIFFLVWIEIGGWIDGEIDHQFFVNDQVGKNLQINMDIVVAMPCNFINTNVLDITSDRLLATDYLTYQGINFFIPENYLVNIPGQPIKTPEIDEIMRESLLAEFRELNNDKNSGAPACHIFGSIPVNRVSGDFHITAKGVGYLDRSSVPIASLNFTHVISEFSFGEFYPYLTNPLDFTAKVTKEQKQSYQYYMSVVPTTYKKLGVELQTYQYSLTEQDKLFKDLRLNHIPGIFFKYDFEPISLLIQEKRISFIRFMTRLITICGGIMISFQWFYKSFDQILIFLFGKKFAQRGQEKPKTLLDQDIKTNIE
ncbi:Erv41p [Ascoidea rubescens DSM 1968]|uniref:Endoplasmic reticulum-Golgi intermediate compartment protein n=1 Tax=Ascoidea rubescens DSM 1968 TaxID=1344418 RepID=A0A1D2VPD0_9ASCO|nr:protein localized to COPII-coated vesicle [Ascoidea rubescens DSM 1968]ODV63456.1 protein localized to COPII-coated vesicle [Ascoidea rubescens DSM 1968]